MDVMDDSENNAKISDSGYSNSCSNSQSRRSHSSKSTHSGSHSSGSSGYGGKLLTSASINNVVQPQKKEKDAKKKKLIQLETLTSIVRPETECRPPDPVPIFDVLKEEPIDVCIQAPQLTHIEETVVEDMVICDSEGNSLEDETSPSHNPLMTTSINFPSSHPASITTDGFSCLISMHDGVVMYITSSLTSTLGFPKDMWIGRSFIDFVHPKDRNTFASQITNNLAVPKIVNSTQDKAHEETSISTVVCRIRRYRGLTIGFGVKDRVVTYMPFLLRLTLKNIDDEEGSGNNTYLIIQATPFYSAFKVPNELMTKVVPFVIRHAPNGHIEYIDPQSVPYLGHLPQDLANKDTLQMYHPDDLTYLTQVYESIVKQGSVNRTKPYRMMTHNGDYVKMETEWSSFINPWSKKLEFVIGKHYIIEGPANPDVLQSPDPEKALKLSEEDKNKAQALRENIVRIMNEVLTKPAEVAKQQMSKRCHDLALYMESLIEEQPKTSDELRLEMQDPDHSYFERDSVMLGGISPHHDCNDSKSSTETPLSYNQLNYNDNLHRYFASHQPFSYEDYNTVTGENVLGMMNAKTLTSDCISPTVQNCGDSGELTSSCGSSALLETHSPLPMGDYMLMRLTESLLSKHNAEMEKELKKCHRETRSSTKGEREKVSNETRQKKMEHLARCNASFQPTHVAAAAAAVMPAPNISCLKRTSKLEDTDASAHKYHCSSQHIPHRMNPTTETAAQPSSTLSNTAATNYWAQTPVNNMNTFILGVGLPQPMPLMSPMTTMPVQCMMYGQPIYGSPFVYSAVNPPVTYAVQPSMMANSIQYTNSYNPLELTSSNYEEACKGLQLGSMPMKPGKYGEAWREKKRAELQARSSKYNQGCADSSSSTSAINRDTQADGNQSVTMKSTFSSEVRSTSQSLKSTEVMPGPPREVKPKAVGQNNEEVVDKTDGESSYSSFYSSFFKTESGSAEESGDAKKQNSIDQNRAKCATTDDNYYQRPRQPINVPRRKMEPPWMEQVYVTSELMYKYQVRSQNIDEVLTNDKKKMTTLEQPSLVNEQLNQLYSDLQLEGVTSRLTLEEGITSSSSSGEETSSKVVKVTQIQSPRRKREYSKLVMIYEENAPLPPPDAIEPSVSA